MWGSVCGEGGLQEPGLKCTRLLVKALSQDARREKEEGEQTVPYQDGQ